MVFCELILFGRHILANPNGEYYFADYTKDVEDIVYCENGAKIYYPNIPQSNFSKIPGCTIGYYINKRLIDTYSFDTIDMYSKPSKGMMPGSEFLRYQWEVSMLNIENNVRTHEESKLSDLKWYPYYKGGTFRRWYGNKEYVVDYQHDGERVKPGDRNPSIYFKDNINWSKISSSLFSARTGALGSLYDDAACQCFVYDNTNYHYILALLNSKYAQKILWCKSQTFNYISSEVSKIPILLKSSLKEFVNQITKQNIVISKQDWDAHETSWDFQENELVAFTKDKAYYSSATIEGELAMEWITLENVVNYYKSKWEKMFRQLHANEEELNRQFIEIYGLQDELTPDVPLEEVTILQQGEKSIENGQIKWHDDVIVKQLISYAIGVWMGRYRLDKPGLHIAHPEPTAEDVCSYEYSGNNVEIDDDGIIPVLSSDSSFADNACHRLRDFLRIVFGADTLIENINFIQNALGKDIETYFLKDFWKDHKKMYQNRPIYWLFSSKKGAFQCLVYMHRMDAYTAERVRSKYLLPHMESLGVRIAELRAEEAMLSTAKRRTLDRLVKELEECREYHDRLHLVADQQIAFDLDDGVVVNHAKFGDVLAKIK